MCKLTLLGRCKSEKISFTITKKQNYWQTLVYSMSRENIAAIIKMGFLNQSSLLKRIAWASHCSKYSVWCQISLIWSFKSHPPTVQTYCLWGATSQKECGLKWGEGLFFNSVWPDELHQHEVNKDFLEQQILQNLWSRVQEYKSVVWNMSRSPAHFKWLRETEICQVTTKMDFFFFHVYVELISS